MVINIQLNWTANNRIKRGWEIISFAILAAFKQLKQFSLHIYWIVVVDWKMLPVCQSQLPFEPTIKLEWHAAHLKTFCFSFEQFNYNKNSINFDLLLDSHLLRLTWTFCSFFCIQRSMAYVHRSRSSLFSFDSGHFFYCQFLFVFILTLNMNWKSCATNNNKYIKSDWESIWSSWLLCVNHFPKRDYGYFNYSHAIFFFSINMVWRNFIDRRCIFEQMWWLHCGIGDMGSLWHFRTYTEYWHHALSLSILISHGVCVSASLTLLAWISPSVVSARAPILVKKWPVEQKKHLTNIISMFC